MTFRLLSLLTLALLALPISGCMSGRPTDTLLPSPAAQDALLKGWPPVNLEVDVEIPAPWAANPRIVAKQKILASDLKEEAIKLLNQDGPVPPKQNNDTAITVKLQTPWMIMDTYTSPLSVLGYAVTLSLLPGIDDYNIPVTAELYHKDRKLDSTTYTAGARTYFSTFFPTPLFIPKSKPYYHAKLMMAQRVQSLREVLLDIGAKYQLANLQSSEI